MTALGNACEWIQSAITIASDVRNRKALVFAVASHLTQPASSSTLSLLQVIYVLFITLMGFQIVVDDLEPNFLPNSYLESLEISGVSIWVLVLLSAHKVEPLLPFWLHALHLLPFEVFGLWPHTSGSVLLHYLAPWGLTWITSPHKRVVFTVYRLHCPSRAPSGVWASCGDVKRTQFSCIGGPDLAFGQFGLSFHVFCYLSLCLIRHLNLCCHTALDVICKSYELEDLLANLLSPSLRFDLYAGTIKHVTRSANNLSVPGIRDSGQRSPGHVPRQGILPSHPDGWEIS
jgi:hypothetical protein